MDELRPLLLCIVIVLSIGCGYLYFVITQAQHRRAKAHLSKLQENWSEGTNATAHNHGNAKQTLALSGAYADAGMFDASAITTFKKQQRAAMVYGGLGFCVLGILASGAKILPALLYGVIGICVGFLYAQRMLRVRQQRFERELTFFLPIVMERMVMAVQAGLDVIPAIQIVAAPEAEQVESLRPLLSSAEQDPVSKLLGIVARLCEAGLPFEQALKEVTGSIRSVAIKHSFLHLAVAHKEGGELVGPLRELSDATQLYYQETVEEEIAVMPVKATVPLLVTFAGLLIIFITSPVLQITKFTKTSMPQQGISRPAK